MPGFMRQSGSHAPRRYFALFGIESSRNNDRFDAILAEFGESQYAIGKVFVLRHGAKTLLNKAINAYGLGRIRIESFFPQFIAASPVNLTWFEVRPFGKRTGFGSKCFHFFGLGCLSPFF